MNESIRDDETVPLAYQLYRRDRGSRGSGVAVIAKKRNRNRLRNQIDNHESLFLRVMLSGIIFFTATVYRCPDSNDDYMIQLYDEVLKLQGRNLIVTGDFNLPNIN